jgi:ribosomal protein L21E
MCATSTDGMQLLKGLQEEGNGTKLPNRQKTQWVLIFAQIPLSTYLKQYKVGDIVDVVANGTQPRK